MRIQHNIMAMNAYRNYTNNVSAMQKNLEKLSSGYKINRAGDDAAGLAISEKMRAQITGLETAQKNAKDGISLVQTAEGALTEVHDMLNRMVELATQSANGTYDNTTDRAQMQKEVNQLLEEIDRIADSSNFNGINLLDGSLGMNKEAISNITYFGAEGQAADVTLATAAVVATNTIHGKDGTTFSSPSLTIDLGDVKIKATKANQQFTINIGSIALTATMGNTSASATVGAATLATKLTAKYTGTGVVANGLKIGDAYYKVTGTKGSLKLELAGVATTGGSNIQAVTSTTNTEKFTASMASAFTTKINPGAAVSVAATGGAKIQNDNSYIHGVTSYNPAAAKGDKERWGVDIDLSTSLMQNGNQLVIASKTFTIELNSSIAKSTLAGNTIKISTKNAATAAAQLKDLIDVLEGATTTKFKVSGKSATKIHVDAKASATGVTADMLKTVVSAKKPGAAAHNAGVSFDVKASAFTKGDVINVGGKEFVYQGSASNGFASVADLKSKLVTAFGSANVATAAGSAAGTVKFTVSASTATGAAPSIGGRGLTLQIGDTSDDFNQLRVSVKDMHARSLGIEGLDISNETAAQAAIAKIKAAINDVSDVRGTLGATQNRLDHTINNLSVMTENIQDAESTIRDTDVAEEMMAYTKNNILIQSAQAMLAQANQVPQGVLQLLQ